MSENSPKLPSTPTPISSVEVSLGDIIQIIAPSNSSIHDQIYLIEYIDETKIKLKVSGREDKFFLSLDSRSTTIDSTTEIFIEKSAFTLNIAEINQQTFIKTLRDKLLWGQDIRN